MRDVVRPSKSEGCFVLAKSSLIWGSYTEAAEANGQLLSDCVDVSATLSQVPAFLDSHGAQCQTQYKLKRDDNRLWASGKSIWRTTNGECSLPKKVIPQDLLVGVSSYTPVSFTEEDRFRDWPGVQNVEEPVKGNCLAVLVLAWCYILSAKWVETLGSVDESSSPNPISAEGMSYIEDWACWNSDTTDNTDDISVEVPDVNEGARRWWAALLARGVGWQASIRRFGKTYLSPWSVRVEAKGRFTLRMTTKPAKHSPTICGATSSQPPSSSLALEYLCDFCKHHGIYGQYFAALAATLLVPYRAGFGPVYLPKPCLLPVMHSSPVQAGRINLQKQGEFLPFYMSLSCNTQGIRPLLHGSFFEPTVLCNLVSPWLKGALDTIDSIVQRQEYSSLATVMGKRQPKTAALWLGAIILGMESHIISPVRAGMFAIDMLASAWTGTAHSFIGPKRLIPSTLHSEKISRSDECRLLYLADPEAHSRMPVCPWKPFGEIDLTLTDIEVRKHASCSGKHCLQYESWIWDLQDGSESSPDRGFVNHDSHVDIDDCVLKYDDNHQLQDERQLLSEELSEIATRSIFDWLRSDGYPAPEREIWIHPWLATVYDDEEWEQEGEQYEDSVKLGEPASESPRKKEKHGLDVKDWVLGIA